MAGSVRKKYLLKGIRQLFESILGNGDAFFIVNVSYVVQAVVVVYAVLMAYTI